MINLCVDMVKEGVLLSHHRLHFSTKNSYNQFTNMKLIIQKYFREEEFYYGIWSDLIYITKKKILQDVSVINLDCTLMLHVYM